MEILLEPTSNKLMVGDLCDSIRIKPVTTGKKRWLILTDSKEHIKMDVERRSVKVKELQDKRILKAFKLSYQEKYEHVGLKSQDHKMARLQDDVKRLYLVDDLKRASLSQLLMTPSPKSLMLSLEPSDAGTRNCDAVSTICMPS
ncbi:hypothetical protein Tco_0789412 [Tanacetum coccineum]